MAAVTIHSDFGAQECKICHCFYFLPSIWHEVMGTDAMILVLWMLSLKPAFSLFSFTLIRKLFSSFSSVQSLSHIRLFATPWTAAYQAILFISNTQSLLKLLSIESVMPSSHLILCCPLLLPPSIFPSNRVFSNESLLGTRWLKYWSFSFSILFTFSH